VARDDLRAEEHFYYAEEYFYYAEEFNLSWMPTLKAMWGPKGRQVMIQTQDSTQEALRHRSGRLPQRPDGGADP
jgi:hypothetical protein